MVISDITLVNASRLNIRHLITYCVNKIILISSLFGHDGTDFMM